MRVAKRSRVSLKGEVSKTGFTEREGRWRTFRYGRPRFVTFIMWEEVAWGTDSGMAESVDGLGVDWGGCGEGRRENWKGGERRGGGRVEGVLLSDLKKLLRRAPGRNCQIGKHQPLSLAFQVPALPNEG
jgi:hypothetical protein